MRRTWIRSLFRSWGVRDNHRPITRRLSMEYLEDRALPSTTVSFQQGTNGYTGTTEDRIDNSAPNTATNGATTGFYFLDGTNSGDLTSPNQWDLIRFDSLFASQGGPIPDGAIIDSALLQYTTGSSSGTPTDSGSAPTGGPYTAAQMLVPFTTSTTWASLAASPVNQEEGRAGPAIGVQIAQPIGSFRNGAITTGALFSLPATASVGSPTNADVTQTLQNWANNPTTNYGFNIRQTGTNDGWGIRTIGNTNVADHPMLTVTYDDPPASSKYATFQQGVNGYTSTSSVWLQQSGTTTDGNTIAAPVFLDGYLPTDTGSPDDQMLLRFDNLFGSNPGQIPVGSTIDSAAIEITTGGRADSTSA